MASQENKIDKCAIIGIDIENTGHTDDDIIFAIGISWGFVGCDKVLKMQMIMFLREPGTVEEWRKFWLDNGFEMQFLGGDQGKTRAQIEAHLIAEDRAGAGAGAVALFHTVAKGFIR